ncbi:flagellin protein [Aurantimonas manganoxydans SI85-9A1]|jgi:flagellin|uniref:Flagellin n=1 Tax=Aurantimonas manganoxydans (strain ATCC BAA-1229 / DSM 21871 / SI85-9A1) TaxID=287752 RepID=Q1YLM8_AURMS|nr:MULTISPECIES: flagellin [Aurantimonas]MCW7542426.1 flagellin [Aurantimonas litoralis]EAS51703.1 flagellin protein [Aurantimonas manganoxydans SI85-9A1]MCC4297485.1 flagellin [Aurantimonas coralicida]MCD1641485.1 flagellin [Aurantimonas coralicida]MDE0924946.1 flagellin [Aurantimonas coralicida]
MTSINTNTSAMTALQSLSAINSSLDQTQNRISTGYRVGAASDNAAYWSIATTMRSDNKALGAVQDALGLGQAKVDTAYTGMTAAIDVVDEIKSKLVAAREPGVDKTKINSEIKELQGQLTSIASSASFSGENWLSVNSGAAGYTATKSVVASFNRDSGGNVSVGTIGVDTSKTKLFDSNGAAGILDTGRTGGTVVSTFTLTGATTDANISTMISDVDEALGAMTTAASNLGAAKSRMDIQSEFVSNLRDSIEKGVGTLVDADMTEESTRLKALQTQQQLGVQALSIANSSSQSLLSLFR